MLFAIREQRTLMIYSTNIIASLKLSMLKPQDCVILVKLLANSERKWSQRELAKVLHISLAEINAGIKRLIKAKLLAEVDSYRLVPIISAAEEFLIHGLKYFLPGKLGEYTRGIPTAVAGPPLCDKFMLGNDPLPVWPDAIGTMKGVALRPLYPSITKSLHEDPDQNFYELLVLIDAIRVGRARERSMAMEMLRERLKTKK